MNTTPDETLLALWLDDELEGEELAVVEAWAITQPDQLAAREEIRGFRGLMRASVPAVEEPPYPDFFNSRIQKAIREQAPANVPVPAAASAPAKTSFWRSWFVPATAFAGMALAFWVGTISGPSAPGAVSSTIGNASPVVYTPEQGVDAQWFAGSSASAPVIVLKGVSAISDNVDFSETASLPPSETEGSTAGGLSR